jgi:hypothetical protein
MIPLTTEAHRQPLAPMDTTTPTPLHTAAASLDSDLDYNDDTFVFTDVTAAAPAASTPEPGTFALL